MGRYRLTFEFFDVEDEDKAKAFCERQNKNPYIRKYHNAHYLPWDSQDGKEHKIIVWYVVK